MQCEYLVKLYALCSFLFLILPYDLFSWMLRGMDLHKSSIYRRRFAVFSLACLLGLLFGPITAAGMDVSTLSLMRLVAVSQVSIFSLLPACVLPFLIAAIAVSINRFVLVFFLAFLRYYAWSFLAWMCVRSFGTSAWLVQPLLQFSDSASLFIFSICCVRWCAELPKSVGKDLVLAVIGVVVMVITDYFAVSQFLAGLF